MQTWSLCNVLGFELPSTLTGRVTSVGETLVKYRGLSESYLLFKMKGLESWKPADWNPSPNLTHSGRWINIDSVDTGPWTNQTLQWRPSSQGLAVGFTPKTLQLEATLCGVANPSVSHPSRPLHPNCNASRPPGYPS